MQGLPAVYGKLISGKQQNDQDDLDEHSKQNEWIWEYVLKNCKDYQTTTLLLDAIPIPDTPLIKKLALLKLLTFDSTSATFSDRDLFALTGLEDLFRNSDTTSGSSETLLSLLPELHLLLKAELALQHLRDGRDDMASFADAVERYWGEAVPDTEAQPVCDAVEETRRNLRDDLWTAKSNPRMRRYVVKEHGREKLEELMKRFLEIAWEKVGPVFLERAEDDILHGRYVPSSAVSNPVLDSSNRRKKKRIRKTLLPVLDELPGAAAEGDGDGGVSDKSDSLRNNPPPWTDEALKDEKREKRKLRRLCPDEPDEEEEQARQSPRVERVLNELKQSQLDLKQQVVDPLPEAIAVARNLTKEGKQPQEQKKAEVDQQTAGTRAKLMDRNPTARTCQWDEEDEIETSPRETSPTASKRLNLPSTSGKRYSPLRRIEPLKQAAQQRRKFTRWTTTEEDALRRGVEQFGKGRWKAILQDNSDIFENRTEVDLKDKWRNIEKAEGIKR